MNRWLTSIVVGAGACITALAAPAQADVISAGMQRRKQFSSSRTSAARPAPHLGDPACRDVPRRSTPSIIATPYSLNLTAEPGASAEAAAAAAGHAVLTSFYPNQQKRLDAALSGFLGKVPDGDAKTKGIALGKKAAADMIALRANDGFGTPETYRPYTTAGVYVPTVIPINSSVSATTPWIMTSASQLRPPPPPALDSETWTKDVNESGELGGLESTKRTAEQTDIARFWFISGPQIWNPIVRQAAAQKKLNLLDSARVFALTAMAGNDSIIAVFDAKYTYNFWRPVTAIRNADLSKNPATPRDPSWVPLSDTPLHPEYPCAHCINVSSVGGVLQKVLGDEAELSMTSSTLPGMTRKWSRVQDYINEVNLARIYGGFHYRNTTKVGGTWGASSPTSRSRRSCAASGRRPQSSASTAGGTHNAGGGPVPAAPPHVRKAPFGLPRRAISWQ